MKSGFIDGMLTYKTSYYYSVSKSQKRNINKKVVTFDQTNSSPFLDGQIEDKHKIKKYYPLYPKGSCSFNSSHWCFTRSLLI